MATVLSRAEAYFTVAGSALLPCRCCVLLPLCLLECQGSAEALCFVLMLGVMRPCAWLLAVANQRDVLLSSDYSCGQGQRSIPR